MIQVLCSLVAKMVYMVYILQLLFHFSLFIISRGAFGAFFLACKPLLPQNNEKKLAICGTFGLKSFQNHQICHLSYI